jgi:hypothetical protein
VGRFEDVIGAIDAANAADPFTLEIDGVERPKEQVHAELMTEWVRRLDPNADELQLIAARANHLRRWELPRTDYPEGRAGYLRWRTEQKRRHAVAVGELMTAAGYGADEIERVGQILRKQGLATDPAVQVHEDALCLVFLQTQFASTAAKLGADKTIDVVRKTVKKMSPAAMELAASLALTPEESALLAAALAPES